MGYLAVWEVQQGDLLLKHICQLPWVSQEEQSSKLTDGFLDKKCNKLACRETANPRKMFKQMKTVGSLQMLLILAGSDQYYHLSFL